MWAHPKKLFLIIFNAITRENNYIRMIQHKKWKRLNSFCLKYRIAPRKPIHWASLAEDPEEVTVSPKFSSIQLKSKEHQVQNKLKGQSPGEPVHSAAMQRLHSSCQETCKGNFRCFFVTLIQPSAS